MKPIIKLTLLLLAILLPATTSAYDFKVNGIYYNITNSTNRTVEVTYQSYTNGTYVSDYSGNVNIPSTVTYYGTTYTVTRIGYDAFSNCSGLTSVTIPNFVITINRWAFKDCSGLTSVTIPNSVTTISEGAFYGCIGLTSVTIGNSVTSIGYYAFENCSGLTSVTIPNSVTSISSYAFEGCNGLRSIIVNNGNTKYDSRNNCNAIIETGTNMLIVGCMNTVIPNSVITIANYAFRNCSSLTSVTIPNSVTTIGDCAFENCSGLTSVFLTRSPPSAAMRSITAVA